MINKIPFIPPEFQNTSFNCPCCNAFSSQIWKEVKHRNNGGYFSLEELNVCFCTHCKKYSIWYEGNMIVPDFSGIEPPNNDLNIEIQEDYNEAAAILRKSPRGAAALLRLAVQKLCIQLGEKGKDLNNDIGNLVKQGLSKKVQESLDTLRVIGNEAVHPGTLDLKDDENTAISLFKLINFIAEKMITEPKEIDNIYSKIPDIKKEQINERDQKYEK